MATYSYDFPDGIGTWQMQIIQCKIYAAFDKDPTTMPELMGLSSSEYSINVHFNRDLSAAEKTTLDGVMAQANLGFAPAQTGYTKIVIPNFTTKWKEIETDTGLNIDFVFLNPDTDNIEIWSYGNITTTNRNKLLTKLQNLISITKY